MEACDGRRVLRKALEALHGTFDSGSGSKLGPKRRGSLAESEPGALTLSSSVMHFGLFSDGTLTRNKNNSPPSAAALESKSPLATSTMLTSAAEATSMMAQSKSMKNVPKSPRLLLDDANKQTTQHFLAVQDQLQKRFAQEAKEKRREEVAALEAAKESAQDTNAVVARQNATQQQVLDNWHELSSLAVRQLGGIARQGELSRLYEDPPVLSVDAAFPVLHTIDAVGEVHGLHVANSLAERSMRVTQLVACGEEAVSTQYVPNQHLQWDSVLQEDVQAATKTEDAVRTAKARSGVSTNPARQNIPHSPSGGVGGGGRSRRRKIAVSIPSSERLVIHIHQAAAGNTTSPRRFLQQESQKYNQLPPLSHHIAMTAEQLQADGKELILREQRERAAQFQTVEQELVAQLRVRKFKNHNADKKGGSRKTDDDDDDYDDDETSPTGNLEPDELATQAVDALLHAKDPKLFGMNGFDTDTVLYPQFSELLHQVNRNIKKTAFGARGGGGGATGDGSTAVPVLPTRKRQTNVQDRIEQNLLVRQMIKKDPAVNEVDDPAKDLKAWRERAILLTYAKQPLPSQQQASNTAMHALLSSPGSEEGGGSSSSVAAIMAGVGARRVVPSAKEVVENEMNLTWRQVVQGRQQEIDATGTARTFGAVQADRKSFPFDKASW